MRSPPVCRDVPRTKRRPAGFPSAPTAGGAGRGGSGISGAICGWSNGEFTDHWSGRWSCHGSACSSWAATCRSWSSLSRRCDELHPTGRSSRRCVGTDIAGFPRWFHNAVNGIQSRSARANRRVGRQCGRRRRRVAASRFVRPGRATGRGRPPTKRRGAGDGRPQLGGRLQLQACDRWACSTSAALVGSRSPDRFTADQRRPATPARR